MDNNRLAAPFATVLTRFATLQRRIQEAPDPPASVQHALGELQAGLEAWQQSLRAPQYPPDGPTASTTPLPPAAAQRESAGLARRGLDAAPEGIWVIDEQARTSYVNSCLADMLGYTPAEMLGRRLYDFMDARAPAAAPDYFAPPALGLTARHGCRLRCKDGSDCWTLVATTPLLDPAGTFRGVLAQVTDVTARRSGADQVRAHTRLLELVTDVGVAITALPTLHETLLASAEAVVRCLAVAFAHIWILDPTGVALDLQASAGLPPPLDSVHNRIPVGASPIGRIARDHMPYLTNALPADSDSGGAAWMAGAGLTAFAGYPLLMNGRLLGVLAVFAQGPLPPITLQALGAVAAMLALGIQRQHTDAQLRDSEERYRAVMETAADAVFVVDAVGTILSVNSAAERIFGYGPSELQNQRMTILVPHALHARLLRAMERYLATGTQPPSWAGLELPGRHKNGAMIPLEISFGAFSQGGRYRFTAIARDITTRKQGERMRRTRAAQQEIVAQLGQQALAGANLPVLMNAAVTRIAQVLEVKYSQLLELRPAGGGLLLRAGVGWPPELVGRATVGSGGESLAGYTLQSQRPVILADLGRETRFQGSHLLREHGVVSAVTVPIPGQPAPCGVLGVATTRPRVFTADDVHFLQAVAHVLATAIARNHAEVALREREAVLNAIFAASPDMITLLDPQGQILAINPAVTALLGYPLAQRLGSDAVELLHPEDRTWGRQVFRSLAQGHDAPDQQRARYQHTAGHSVVLEARSRAIADATGQITAVVQVSRDVTEQVRFEEALQQARQAAEWANQAKNALLSRMSHELRTPLHAILGFAQLLDLDAAELAPQHQESLEQILRAGWHLLSLIDEVLDIVQIETGQLGLVFAPVDVHAMVTAALDHVRPLAYNRGVQLTPCAIQPGESYVRADPQRLQEVLGHLISNAVQYNHAAGIVTVLCLVVAADRLRIEVRDTGPGLTHGQQARLFTPFDRLGSEQTGGTGTGLGLATVRRLMEAMDGRLGVETTLGAGSTFWIELPRVAGPVG